MALFRIVGQCSGALFSYFIFGFAETHTKQIYIGCALVYLAAFITMCLLVKEGSYPPPPPNPGSFVRRQANNVRTYLRECFSLAFYRWIFIKQALWSVGHATGMFAIFFAKDLGMSNDDFGKVHAYAAVLTMILLYPMGWMSDRFNPVRMYFISMILAIPLTLASFFCIIGPKTFMALAIIKVPIGALMQATGLPLLMVLFPKQKHGQFASAQAMVNAGVLIVGSLSAGYFLDRMGNNRYMWLWMFGFEFLSFCSMIMVYRGWKRQGGTSGYVPPEVKDVTNPEAVKA
jgi:MFS-type transporter involved in bile tolerance (Atg22 family)